MRNRRSTRPRRRAPMRRRFKRRGRKTAGREKVYNYSVNLLPQYLVNTAGNAAGSVNVVSDQTVLAPIVPPGGGLPATIGIPDAAGCGVANYYSFGMALPSALSDLQNFSQ